MSKKGYTTLELVVVLALVSMLMYSTIYVPANLMEKYNNYIFKSRDINDLALLRTAIINDLNSSNIEIIDANTLNIGKSKYTFGEQVSRENLNNKINITNDSYYYKIENNVLIVYNDKVVMKYSLISSFKESGENIE